MAATSSTSSPFDADDQLAPRSMLFAAAAEGAGIDGRRRLRIDRQRAYDGVGEADVRRVPVAAGVGGLVDADRRRSAGEQNRRRARHEAQRFDARTVRETRARRHQTPPRSVDRKTPASVAA
jgi:hypothetical protein